MGPTVLFTHFKIILLQYFQFSVLTTISSIQTDPLSATISMHSFIATDHDRTALKSENHLFYFNLHVNLVVKSLFFFFFHLLTTAWNLNLKICNPLIYGKDRD